MTDNDASKELHGPRFITGGVLLAGHTLAGLGAGLLLTDPGAGLILGFGLGLVVIGSVRAVRGP